MNRILIFAFICYSCKSLMVTGTYDAVVSEQSSKTDLLKTTLVLNEDFSYIYKVENDVTLLATNEGKWTSHGSRIIFTENKIDTKDQGRAKLIGLRTGMIDSVENLGKKAFSFYMVVQDTSLIIGASLKIDSEVLITSEQPMLVDKNVSKINFEYLGEKFELVVPIDIDANHISYYFDYSKLGNVRSLDRLPFKELTYKKGELRKDQKILYKRAL